MMKSANQTGFTLIELVIVITIIGVLAAVALPRFIALQRDARIAKLNAARGSVAAAAALVHATVLTRNSLADPAPCAGGIVVADNKPGSVDSSGTNVPGSVCTENGLIATVYGYPASTLIPVTGTNNPGIVAAAGLSTVFNANQQNLLDEGYSVNLLSTDPKVTVFQVQGAPDVTTCQFTYTQAASTTNSMTPALISVVTTTGC